jgi:hypothetical protein
MDTDTERDTKTDMEKERDMERVMETDMEMEMDTKWKWTWKRTCKLYLIRPNSPYSAVRIVANMSIAQFQMALCTCSGSLLGKDGHKNFYRYWNYSPNDVLAELERLLWSFKKGRYQRYVQ